VGYWRKIVVGVKGSRDRRDIGRVVAGCWRKDVIEVFSSTGRKEGFAPPLSGTRYYVSVCNGPGNKKEIILLALLY